MKKINIIWLLVLILLPCVLASVDDEDIRFISKQNTQLDIKEQCFNNNSYCSSSATCNISISNPNQILLIDNKLMTNQVSFHNYTINSQNTSETGLYEVIVTCVDVNKGYEIFYFKISPNGYVDKPEYVIGLGILLIGLLFFLIYLSKSISEEHQSIKLLFNWFTLIILLPIIWFIKLVASNFNVTIGNIIGYIYYTYLPILTFLSFYFIISFIKYILESMAQKKQTKEDDLTRVK